MSRINKIFSEIRYIILNFLHISAMYFPNSHIKRFLYRLRGAKIGKGVDIGMFVFMEEFFPNLVKIEDGVDIGPRAMFIAHDSSKHNLRPEIPIVTGEVVIKKKAYVGAGVIVLPGVTIGSYSIIGAGAVVTRDVPPRTVFAGVPARQIGIVTKQGDIVIKKRVE